MLSYNAKAPRAIAPSAPAAAVTRAALPVCVAGPVDTAALEAEDSDESAVDEDMAMLEPIDMLDEPRGASVVAVLRLSCEEEEPEEAAVKHR